MGRDDRVHVHRCRGEPHNAGLNDAHAIFDYPTVAGFGWHTATGVPSSSRHHGDLGRAMGHVAFRQAPAAEPGARSRRSTAWFSATTIASSRTSSRIRRSAASSSTWRRRKASTWAISRWSLRADVLNVFNWDNPDTFENFRGFDGVPNADYGQSPAWRQPTRTFKLSFNVGWR